MITLSIFLRLILAAIYCLLGLNLGIAHGMTEQAAWAIGAGTLSFIVLMYDACCKEK